MKKSGPHKDASLHSIHYACWISYKPAGNNLIRNRKISQFTSEKSSPLETELGRHNFLEEGLGRSHMAKSFTAKQVYYFRAKPEKVFDALTQPKTLVRWFLSKARVEPMAGGTFSFDWMGGYHMVSKLKKFEKDKAVSFVWIDKLKNGTLAKTTASFEIARKGQGTLLRLRHSGFKEPEHFADCSSRWAYYLTNMKSVLDNSRDLRSRYDW